MADAAKRPIVSDRCHYVNSGHSLGTSASTCRAAIITEVKNDTTVSMAVFTPRGTLFYEAITYDEGKAAGTWHWAELDSVPTSSIYPATMRTPGKPATDGPPRRA